VDPLKVRPRAKVGGGSQGVAGDATAMQVGGEGFAFRSLRSEQGE